MGVTNNSSIYQDVPDENQKELSDEEVEEGISFYDYVVQTCGKESIQNFSSQIDLHSIRVICLLGQGAFAKVFFVKKLEEETYYAMKVLDKNTLK